MPDTAPLILVICTGNICRSPMCEALFTHRLQASHTPAQVISRGLAAVVGAAPHRHAIEVAQANQAPIDPDKRAASVTLPELTAATVVFVMDSGHRKEVLERFPTASGKTFLLGQWQSCEVIDPVGQPRDAFERAWLAIDAGTRSWLDHLHQAGLLTAGSTP